MSVDALAQIREEDAELRRIRNRFLRGSLAESPDEMFAAVEQLVEFRMRQALRRKEV